VRQVGYLKELNRDARSTKHTIIPHIHRSIIILTFKIIMDSQFIYVCVYIYIYVNVEMFGLFVALSFKMGCLSAV